MGSKENLAFPVGLAVYSAVLFCSTFSMRTLALTSVGPDVAPRIISGALGTLSLLVIVLGAYRRGKGASQAEAGAEGVAENESGRFTTIGTLALLVAYVAAFDRLGFILSTFSYLYLQVLLIRGWGGWRRTVGRLIFAALASAAIYAIFVKLLSMPLPDGWLG